MSSHKSLFWQILYAIAAVVTLGIAYAFPRDDFVPMEFWTIRAAFVMIAIVFVIQLIREMRG